MLLFYNYNHCRALYERFVLHLVWTSPKIHSSAMPSAVLINTVLYALYSMYHTTEIQVADTNDSWILLWIQSQTSIIFLRFEQHLYRTSNGIKIYLRFGTYSMIASNEVRRLVSYNRYSVVYSTCTQIATARPSIPNYPRQFIYTYPR